MKIIIKSSAIALIMICMLGCTSSKQPNQKELSPPKPIDVLAILVGYKYYEAHELGYQIPVWSLEKRDDFAQEYLFEIIHPYPHIGEMVFIHYDMCETKPLECYEPSIIYHFTLYQNEMHDFGNGLCCVRNWGAIINTRKEGASVELITLKEEKNNYEITLQRRKKHLTKEGVSESAKRTQQLRIEWETKKLNELIQLINELEKE